MEETGDDKKKTQKVLHNIPKSVMKSAKGVAIFTVFRTGLGLSGASGSGVVVSRKKNGEWGAPSGILIHTLAFGFLIGIDVYDVVLVLRTERAVRAFTKPKISIGGEISVSAGPVGNGLLLDSGIEMSPAWSYTKSKGLFAGVQLDGTIILERGDENERTYHRRLSTAELFDEKAEAPYIARGLIQTLKYASGENADMSLIPGGGESPAPQYCEEFEQTEQPSYYDGKIWYPSTPPLRQGPSPLGTPNLSESPKPKQEPFKASHSRENSAVWYPESK